MTFILLLTIVSIVSFLVYKFVLKNLKKQEKETIEKNMKDYDKYHNKLEELNLKIKELSEIGIKGYANKFVWEKLKSSIILKFSILTPIISSFVITVQKLEPICEPYFSDYSYGFRPNRSCEKAILKLLDYLNEDYIWIVDIDLEKFFDNVPHDKLMSYVHNIINDDCNKHNQIILKSFLYS